MPKLIRAIVKTNSSEDSYSRVKVSSPGIWEESGLICSVGGIPLKEGDSVYVDVASGYEYPIIIGRSMDDSNEFKAEVEGSLLFESCNGDSWTTAFVKEKKLNLVNSDGLSMIIDGKVITVENSLKLELTDEKLTMDNLEVVINGGDNQGMIKIKELTQKLNDLVKWCNAHTHIIMPGGVTTVGTPTTQSNSVPVQVPKPLSPANTFIKNDYENTKVKH